MKKLILSLTVFISAFSTNATSIILTKNINKMTNDTLEQDFNKLDQFLFDNTDAPQLKAIMELAHFSNRDIISWLEERVHYIVPNETTSNFNMKIKRTLYVEEKNIIYPNDHLRPFSKESNSVKNKSSDENENSSNIQLSNIGASIYLSGKKDKILYGMRLSNGLFMPSQKVIINSPRVGIIQIGEAFTSTLITANKKKINAWPNSIFRLGNLFHEARHSDGNGSSLAFVHATCPRGHAYEGAEACDESLNGPYSLGAYIVAEMAKECATNCSIMDKETLLLVTYDYLGRVITPPTPGGRPIQWDPTPESL